MLWPINVCNFLNTFVRLSCVLICVNRTLKPRDFVTKGKRVKKKILDYEIFTDYFSVKCYNDNIYLSALR